MDTARELTANLAALLRREHDALADFLGASKDLGDIRNDVMDHYTGPKRKRRRRRS